MFEPAGQNVARLGLEKTERPVERNCRRDQALDAHGIQLLKFLQLAGLRCGLERGECGQRNEPVLGPTRNVHVAELIRGQPRRALHLRNDFVAASLNAEAVHVVASEQRRQVASGLAEIHSLRSELVAIEDHLGLRLIELEIRIGENEHPVANAF